MHLQELINAAAKATGGKRALARRLGLHHPAVFQWVAGTARPTTPQIHAMLESVGTPTHRIAEETIRLDREARPAEWERCNPLCIMSTRVSHDWLGALIANLLRRRTTPPQNPHGVFNVRSATDRRAAA